MAKISRLFFCELEDEPNWSGGRHADVCSSLKRTDKVVLYRTGRRMKTNTAKSVAKRMEDTGLGVIVDAMDMNDIQIADDMKGQIAKCANPSLSVFFITTIKKYAAGVDDNSGLYKTITLADRLSVGGRRPPAVEMEYKEETKEQDEIKKENMQNPVAGNKNKKETVKTDIDKDKDAPMPTISVNSEADKTDVKGIDEPEPREENKIAEGQKTEGGTQKKKNKKKNKRAEEVPILSDAIIDGYMGIDTGINAGNGRQAELSSAPEEKTADPVDTDEYSRQEDNSESVQKKTDDDKIPAGRSQETWPSGHAPENDKNTQTKKEEDRDKRAESRDDKREPDPINDKRNQKPFGNKRRDDDKKDKGKVKPKPPYDEPSMDDLYRMIWGSPKKDTAVEKIEYTELDDAKAQTISLLEERLFQNIDTLLPEFRDQQPNREIYLELISALISSEDYKDFQYGWDVIQPQVRIPAINETIYKALYDEAEYYARACEILYADDRW